MDNLILFSIDIPQDCCLYKDLVRLKKRKFLPDSVYSAPSIKMYLEINITLKESEIEKRRI